MYILVGICSPTQLSSLLQKQGFQLMMQVAQSKDPRERHLVASAQFNIGRAFFQGIIYVNATLFTDAIV